MGTERFQPMPDIKLVGHKPNIFGDEIAFAQKWDFSKANLNEENRILAITQVASICYQSPKALGSESLYNRLAAESMGLPSSSFEFVPVLLDPWNYRAKELLEDTRSNARKYGEWIIHEGNEYLLTNYRAIYYDYEKRVKANMEMYKDNPVARVQANELHEEIYLKFFNTQMECDIIKEHFNVFLFKVDFPTRSQMVRHRVNWQELSRRYVSGKRVGFEFYVSENMKNVVAEYKPTTLSFGGVVATPNPDDVDTCLIGTSEAIDICLEVYFAALEKGVKPQDARRIIPQAAYTQIWGAFIPSQLENYFKLRLDSHAQWEIRMTAEAMKSLNTTTNILKDHKISDEKLAEINKDPKDFLSAEELEDLISTSLA